MADPDLKAKRAVLSLNKAEAEAQLIARLGDIALNSDSDIASASACEKALDRLVGKAVQTNLNLDGGNVHRVISDEPKSEADWLAEHAAPANDVAAPLFGEDDADTDAA